MSHDEPAEDLTTQPPSLHQTSTDESAPIAPVSTDELASLSQLTLDTSASIEAVEEHGMARDAEEKQLNPSEDKPEGLATECVDSVSLDPDVTQDEAQGPEVEIMFVVIIVCGMLRNDKAP